LAGAALAVVVTGLGIASPAGAVPASQLASQPVAVFAVSVDGQHNVYVSWTPPASNGGSPILYFVASTLNGHRRCVVPNPGPNSCIIGRVNGNAHYKIYVRAVTGVGRGRPTVVPNLVIHPGPATPPAGGGAAGGGTPSPLAAPATTTAAVSPAAAVATTAGGTPATGSATIDPPAQLPFTGVDVRILLLFGAGLLLGGWVLRSSSREWRRIGRWIFGI